MCFSPTASFVSSGVLAAIGIATLRHVRERNALLFAATPLLFAVHQFTEGVVWLGLDGRVSHAVLNRAAFLFTLYAQGILPLLMPLAVALMEPPGWRRRTIFWLAAAGVIVCAWDLYGLLFFPLHTFVAENSIAYANVLTASIPISLIYIVATCGALLLSSHRIARWYGALNVIGLTIVEIVRAVEFASVWCFYAAGLSAILYLHFRSRDQAGATTILAR